MLRLRIKGFGSITLSLCFDYSDTTYWGLRFMADRGWQPVLHVVVWLLHKKKGSLIQSLWPVLVRCTALTRLQPIYATFTMLWLMMTLSSSLSYGSTMVRYLSSKPTVQGYGLLMLKCFIFVRLQPTFVATHMALARLRPVDGTMFHIW